MSKKRRYCFTINNPKHEIEFNENKMEYLIYQLEKGKKSGTFHYQGYFRLINPLTIKSCLKLFKDKPHLEECKGTEEQNIKYCTKSDSKIDGPWEFGKKAEQGKRVDIIALRKAIFDDNMTHRQLIMNDNLVVTYAKYIKFVDRCMLFKNQELANTFREITTCCLIGPAGLGKTKYVFDNEGFNNVYTLTNASTELWFDGYDRQEVLLIDDFYGWIKYDFFLRLLDGWPCRLNIKGSSTFAVWKRVYITSNKPVESWYNFGRTDAIDRRINSVIYM